VAACVSRDRGVQHICCAAASAASAASAATGIGSCSAAANCRQNGASAVPAPGGCIPECQHQSPFEAALVQRLSVL